MTSPRMPRVDSSISCNCVLLTSSQVNRDARFKFVGIGCDVSSELEVRNAFVRVLEMFGRLDAVVASAGGCISHHSSIAHGKEVIRKALWKIIPPSSEQSLRVS